MLSQTLTAAFPHLNFKANEPLSTYTYMKSGGPAEVFVSISFREDLEALVVWCEKNHQKYLVLGGASNVLVSDEGIRGLVIRNMASAIMVHDLDEKTTLLEVDSGAITNMVVRKSLDNSLTGLENFLGVPGTIGGAIYNNAHYLNDLIGDYVEDVDVITKTGEKKTYTKQQLKFKYEYSVLQDTHETMLVARFRLKKGDKAEVEETAKMATMRRAATQPLGIPSSGCMFKNPVMPDGTQGYAGKLIDEAGLKGLKVGDAEVSQKHANFILNTGKASTADVLKLAEMVTASIKEKFGVELEREVFLVT